MEILSLIGSGSEIPSNYHYRFVNIDGALGLIGVSPDSNPCYITFDDAVINKIEIIPQLKDS